MYARYLKKRGGLPGKDVEPTDAQLAAVRTVLLQGAPPMVDFAIFGPHGARAQRKLTHFDNVWDPESSKYRKVQVPGPESIEVWEA